MKKIYSVRWDDGDGEQGYFVKMTKVEALKLQKFLIAKEDGGTIENSDVSPIEGEWLLTPRIFSKVFKERYSNT